MAVVAAAAACQYLDVGRAEGRRMQQLSPAGRDSQKQPLLPSTVTSLSSSSRLWAHATWMNADLKLEHTHLWVYTQRHTTRHAHRGKHTQTCMWITHTLTPVCSLCTSTHPYIHACDTHRTRLPQLPPAETECCSWHQAHEDSRVEPSVRLRLLNTTHPAWAQPVGMPGMQPCYSLWLNHAEWAGLARVYRIGTEFWQNRCLVSLAFVGLGGTETWEGGCVRGKRLLLDILRAAGELNSGSSVTEGGLRCQNPGLKRVLIQIPALPLKSHMTLSTTAYLFEPWFLLQNWPNKITWLIGLIKKKLL